MIDDNRQASDDKMNKYYSKIDRQDSKLDNIIAMIKNMIYHNKNSNYLPDNMDSLYAQGPTTVVPSKKKALTTCSSPRRPLFIHALSFECTSKL